MGSRDEAQGKLPGQKPAKVRGEDCEYCQSWSSFPPSLLPFLTPPSLPHSSFPHSFPPSLPFFPFATTSFVSLVGPSMSSLVGVSSPRGEQGALEK